MTDYILNKTVLEAWKRSNNESDQSLAVALGVHITTIGRWLNGHSGVPHGAVVALEKLTKLPQSKLAVPMPVKSEKKVAS